MTTLVYTLRDHEADLRVETWVAEGKKGRNRARLVVDGAEVDTASADEIGEVRLGEDSGHPTRVAWWWTGRVAHCDLVEEGTGDVRMRRTPYAPPTGTRAARVHAWGERHPVLYATRHVALNLGGTLLAILGIGAVVKAFFAGLLARLDLGWLPDLPSLPDWLDPWQYLAPLFRWVPRLLDRLLGWIPDLELGWLKYVIGFLVAVAVGVSEVRRRCRRTDRR